MKIICLKENLKKGLSVAAKAVGKNPNLPILSNVLLEAQKKGLIISATDLELGVNVLVVGKTEKEGKITVPAKLFSDLVNNLSEEKVVLETLKNSLIVSFGESKSIIKGVPSNDFPIIPIPKNTRSIKIKSDDFGKGLSQVINSTSNSDLRPEISGVLVSFFEDGVKMAATDSFRLSEKIIHGNFWDGKKEVESFILPQKTVLELIKTLEDEGSFEMIPEKNQVFFRIGGIELISRIIEGEYPDYSQIIPKSFKVKLSLNRNDFLSTIKLVGLFSTKINDIKIKLSVSGSNIEILSQNVDSGESVSKIKVDIDGKDAQDMEVVFNYKYIIDGLNNIFTEKVMFCLNDNISPAVLRPKADNNYIYIIMPIRS